jgi:retrograde regulation protein 2
MERAAISLYDAQNSKGSKCKIPIPEDVICEVESCMMRFKHICKDYGVPDANVQIVATEATRTAMNSKDFLDRIRLATGWLVTMLSQEEEATIGSDGIAASFASVNGLVLDLGGGSCQLNWMKTGAENLVSKTPVSMPYGAAALTNRLVHEDRKKLQEEVIEAFKAAFEKIQVPSDLKRGNGYHLWACGGGLRGMGYFLISKHPVQPYPIPLINGFTVGADTFTEAVTSQAVHTTQQEMKDSFRISKRRAAQVPAVALVIHALAAAIPQLTHIHFSQGFYEFTLS